MEGWDRVEGLKMGQGDIHMTHSTASPNYAIEKRQNRGDQDRYSREVVNQQRIKTKSNSIRQ